jgi:hypothetical protein
MSSFVVGWWKKAVVTKFPKTSCDHSSSASGEMDKELESTATSWLPRGVRISDAAGAKLLGCSGSEFDA